jgi:hypothetical protein
MVDGISFEVRWRWWSVFVAYCLLLWIWQSLIGELGLWHVLIAIAIAVVAVLDYLVHILHSLLRRRRSRDGA